VLNWLKSDSNELLKCAECGCSPGSVASLSTREMLGHQPALAASQSRGPVRRSSSAPAQPVVAMRRGADKKIRMISQGASEINLTFVIEEDEVPGVIQRLHKTFFSELDPEVFA